jgi:hypothetical protein
LYYSHAKEIFMRETLQVDQMEELGCREALPEIIRNLAAFDDSLAERIRDIRAGYSPNGHHPNGFLSEAMRSDDPVEQQRFIDEYHWVLALRVYAYRNKKEDKRTLMAAAEDGLFIAGETYDPSEEPNFLVYLSETVDHTLGEVFEPMSDPLLPSAERFENFVSQFVRQEYKVTPPRWPTSVRQQISQ